MLRGQQVDTASYQVEFEPRGSCKLLRACDPPWEVAFPKGPLGVSMAVEAIKAVCQKDLLDGSHATLFARAMIVPNAPFRKLVAVHNLRLLLKDHLPREKFKHVKEAGSTLYKLDVDGSDHDIEVVFQDVADDAQIVNLLFAAMTAAQLDVQERSKHRGRSKDYQELAAARLTKFDYGVQISGFPEGTEWDVVATRWSSGLLRQLHLPSVFLLQFVQSHWMNPQMVPEDVPTAGEHVKRIVEGYSLETSPQLKDLDKLMSAAIVKLQSLSKSECDELAVVEELFGSFAETLGSE